jgi:type II secretory pathway predicted ATPase ExeA
MFSKTVKKSGAFKKIMAKVKDDSSLSDEQKAALGLMFHEQGFSAGIHMVTGPAGCGKTHIGISALKLIIELAKKSGEKVRVLVFTDTNMQSDDLTKKIANDLEPTNKSDAYQTLVPLHSRDTKLQDFQRGAGFQFEKQKPTDVKYDNSPAAIPWIAEQEHSHHLQEISKSQHPI